MQMDDGTHTEDLHNGGAGQRSDPDEGRRPEREAGRRSDIECSDRSGVWRGRDRRPEAVTRQVDIAAPPERVWESLATNEGRRSWLEDDPNRVIAIEREEPPRRISWWWFSDTEPARHVDIRVAGIPRGTRVTVTESAPMSFPLATMAAAVGALGPTVTLAGPPSMGAGTAPTLVAA